MTQKQIIESVKGVHAEIDDDGVDIVYSDGLYDFDVRYVAWDGSFEVQVFACNNEVDLLINNKTISTLFDYVSELHIEWRKGLTDLEDTQNYLDIY